MNDFEQILANLTPEVYANLKRAVELGKWPDGRVLSDEQRELCMQAVIVYEHKNLKPEEHTGFIPPKPHTHCGSGDDEPDAETPLKWQ
ncbi:YeaC family protein [Gilvimarinus xylanilyticus]|uniref:YeaC family protein n=1 Tax=Gilvimarinus xylanilyticus TaxID=2944139 RepID=A0A9X2HWN1_9GAMM|nr:YeaC family protein [Gilvimarinus xylanilyticus]MCP8898404.1 YeaC family protein [Gilvimarinus xylanilyticus]